MATSESSKFESLIAQSVESVASRWNGRPRFGIVLGTGAGIVADNIQAQATLPYGSIENFPVSTATGHKGNLVCGTLDGHQVVAMQGRFHLYEGYDVDHATLPIHVMHAMGVEVLFVSNAAGGLNPKMASGDVMLIESHVDFMNRTSPQIAAAPTIGRPTLRSDSAYDREMIDIAHGIARKEGFALHEGVYAAMMGPNYETRAEYRFLRRMGVDVAGMSTVPEVNVAGKKGMRVLAMSIVTNVANPDSLEPTSGQEVIDAARVAAPKLKSIVSGVIEAIAKEFLRIATFGGDKIRKGERSEGRTVGRANDGEGDAPAEPALEHALNFWLRRSVALPAVQRTAIV